MYAFQHGIIASSNGGATPSTLWDSLLAYYTADNTPNDALGTYNGTLVNGATYGTGKINNGFSLDGVNDYVDLGNNFAFDGSTPFSISCWIYPSTVSGARTIFSKQSISAPSYPGYQLQILNGNVRFVMYSDFNTSDYLLKKRALTLSINTWYNITLTYDGSKNTSGVKIYINGSDGTYNENINTMTNNITSNTLKACIRSGNGQSYFFGGVIDETPIWNRELTPTEVTELYNAGLGLQYS